MAHDARVIGNFFLDLAQSRGRDLTILSLLKLIYFAHGWHLATRESPLISNRVEAWKHGPVIRTVYESFPGVQDRPISTRATLRDFTKGVSVVASTEAVSADQASLISWIYEKYGALSAYELSRLTHAPGTPWHMIWVERRGSVSVGLVIEDHETAAYFKRQLNLEARN